MNSGRYRSLITALSTINMFHEAIVKNEDIKSEHLSESTFQNAFDEFAIKREQTTIYIKVEEGSNDDASAQETLQNEIKPKIEKNSFRKCYGKEGFNCNLCDFSSNQKNLIEKHMLKKHKDVKTYNCPCGYFCKTSRDLKRHQLSHTGERPHKCDVCDYAGITSCSLKVHMLVHTGRGV